jgi:hypothetical protein
MRLCWGMRRGGVRTVRERRSGVGGVSGGVGDRCGFGRCVEAVEGEFADGSSVTLLYRDV